MKKHFMLKATSTFGTATQKLVKTTQNEISAKLKLTFLTGCCNDMYPPIMDANVPRTLSLT